MHRIRILALLIAFIIGGTAVLHAEYIFLKDGSIQKGKIITETAAVVSLRLENGTVQSFNRTQIMRILYTDIYMGKHFIRLNTGEMVEAYQVDEDNETLTFRKELNRPEEFTVKRSNVLFMTRTNPTGLEAKPSLTEIRLTWLAPFQAPRRYHVYMKERKEDNYRQIGKTGNRRYTVKGLETKKTYFFIVTAVGMDGGESVPSNEVQIRTNLPPKRPGPAKYTLSNKKDKAADVKLTWKAGADPDGTVTGYRVYQRRQYATEKIDETTALESTVPEVPVDRDNHFFIRTMDDDGAESENRAVSILLRRISITPAVGCALPIGDFGELAQIGAAASLNVSICNFLVNYLQAGLEAGYMRMNCKLDRSYLFNIVPMSAAVAYRGEITPLFSLVPKFSLGCAWMQSKLAKKNFNNMLAEKKRESFEPLIGLGLGARFQIIELLAVGLDMSWGAIVESKPMHFFTLAGSCTLRFKI